jgi:hypothetical protein
MLMPQELPGRDIPTRNVAWPQAWRIIASRYPPIDLFERVSSDPRVRDTLIALEQMTNPRLRDEIGEISLVPAHKRVTGPHASWVMAPFTHINKRGSRFSGGSFGIYYAAEKLETAIAETVHHFSQFASDSNDPPRREDMRVLVGSINNRFENVGAIKSPLKKALLDPDSYAVSQPFGSSRRGAGADGLVYPSVRHRGGHCCAAFWPNVVGIPIQERHLQYDWDGTKVRRYFDYRLDVWIEL